MLAWRLFRTLLLALASFGYLAHGAQAHIHINSGESMDLMLCSTGATRTISVDIPGEPPQETSETACGSCVSAPAIITAATPFLFKQLIFSRPVPMPQPATISPRSPLWPGAPPHGPPSALKA